MKHPDFTIDCECCGFSARGTICPNCGDVKWTGKIDKKVRSGKKTTRIKSFKSKV